MADPFANIDHDTYAKCFDVLAARPNIDDSLRNDCITKKRQFLENADKKFAMLNIMQICQRCSTNVVATLKYSHEIIKQEKLAGHSGQHFAAGQQQVQQQQLHQQQQLQQQQQQQQQQQRQQQAAAQHAQQQQRQQQQQQQQQQLQQRQQQQQLQQAAAQRAQSGASASSSSASAPSTSSRITTYSQQLETIVQGIVFGRLSIPKAIPPQQQAIIQQMVEKRKYEMHLAQLPPGAQADFMRVMPPGFSSMLRPGQLNSMQAPITPEDIQAQQETMMALQALYKAAEEQERLLDQDPEVRRVPEFQPQRPKAELLLNELPTMQLLQDLAKHHSIKVVSPSCVSFIAAAIEQHIVDLLQRASKAARQRTDPARELPGMIREGPNVRHGVGAIAKADKQARERHVQAEQEKLFMVADAKPSKKMDQEQKSKVQQAKAEKAKARGLTQTTSALGQAFSFKKKGGGEGGKGSSLLRGGGGVSKPKGGAAGGKAGGKKAAAAASKKEAGAAVKAEGADEGAAGPSGAPSPQPATNSGAGVPIAAGASRGPGGQLMGAAAMSAGLAKGRPGQRPPPLRDQITQPRRIGQTKGDPAASKKPLTGPGGLPLPLMPTTIGARDLVTVMERDARLSKHTVLWRVAGDMLR